MRWWLAIALSGCNAPDPSGPDESEGPAEDPDPIAAARAVCTATANGTESGAPYAVEVSVYDENGDRVSAETTFEDGGHALRTWEYGNPHEPAVFRDDSDGVEKDLERFDTWEDGNVVRLEFDFGIDGPLDEIEIRTYGDDRLMDTQDWDYDADGVVEDESDYTWEPDGDGWYAVGEGVDPYVRTTPRSGPTPRPSSTTTPTSTIAGRAASGSSPLPTRSASRHTSRPGAVSSARTRTSRSTTPRSTSSDATSSTDA